MIQDQLEEVQTKFLRLLEEIPDRDLERKAIGENWTIKEELVHIVQVVEVIPAGIERASNGGRRSFLGFVPAKLRNWINGHVIIPWKAKNKSRETIAAAYQDAHKVLVNLLAKLNDKDWAKRLPYPRQYRTVEQIAYRPVEHFEEHKTHIRRLLGMKRDIG